MNQSAPLTLQRNNYLMKNREKNQNKIIKQKEKKKNQKERRKAIKLQLKKMSHNQQDQCNLKVSL